MLTERLQGLGVTDPVPAWADLRSEPRFEAQLGALAPEACSVLAEVIERDFDVVDAGDLAMVVPVLTLKIAQLTDGLAFASAIERTVWICLSSEPETGRTGARALSRELLRVAEAAHAWWTSSRARESEDVDEDEDLMLRGRFALGAVCDMVCAELVGPFGLLGALDALADEIPAPLAGVVTRVAGRVAELRDEPFLHEVLQRCADHAEVEADAAIELGHWKLRQALRSEPTEVGALLNESLELYRDAATDERRPDARLHAHAVEALQAFRAGAGQETLAQPLNEVRRAVGELDLYEAEDFVSPSRALGAGTAWLKLCGRLHRAAERRGVDELLRPEQALTPLLDLYADTRVRIVDGPELDLAVAIKPSVQSWIGNRRSAQALDALAHELPTGSPAQVAAAELASLQEHDPGKAWRSRSLPGLPGG